MGLGPGPPSGHRSAAPSSTSGVNSPCAPRASHCQYSTIAYWAQQVAGVGRDPRPKRWSSPDIAPGGYGRKTSRSSAWLVIGRMRLIMSRPVFSFHLLQLEMSANGMSALEELRRSTERQLWAQGRRALSWPTPDRQLGAIDMSKRTFSPAQCCGGYRPSADLHYLASGWSGRLGSRHSYRTSTQKGPPESLQRGSRRGICPRNR
jgi:hypothetical protein